MRLLPFKLAIFFISLTIGILAVTLFLAEKQMKIAERIKPAPSIDNAKPKKIVCSLGENRNDGKSCECKEVEE